MIKASAGGGGRGIRIAHNAAELHQQFTTAAAEAKAAFGNGELYLERFIGKARHIEVQILGDGERVVHCFERECSLQRRRQKVWEEAPSPAIDPATRAALCESALKLANAVSYRGAGTLEYLYDDASREFFFIEMNTRIQVEHPVTEMITGIDLVKEMLRIALGQALRLRQDDIRMSGSAMGGHPGAPHPTRDGPAGPEPLRFVRRGDRRTFASKITLPCRRARPTRGSCRRGCRASWHRLLGSRAGEASAFSGVP